MLHQEVKIYLESLEQEPITPIPFHGEHHIAQQIKEILQKEISYEPTKEDMAEQMAFDFMADYQNYNSDCDTYYGPMYVFQNDTGQMVEYPSIRQVDQEMLKYWEERAKESRNPILSSRYADLVVDFSSTFKVDLVRIVIDANNHICENSLVSPSDCKIKIKRAFDLAIRINDQERIDKTKHTIIRLEESIAIDDKPGLWGFAFKWLILEEPKKVNIQDEERKNLIHEMELRLQRKEKNPWVVDNAVSLLAEYYAREKDEPNLMRVLGVLEKALKTKGLNSDALVKNHSYEQIYRIYKQYASRFGKASEAYKRLAQEIKLLDLDWDKSLTQISSEIEITQEDIETYLNGVFGENENNTLELVMSKIAPAYLLKEDVVKKQLLDISSTHPLQFSLTTHIISDENLLIAKLLPLDEENYETHVKKHGLQYMQVSSALLSLTIDKLRKNFSQEEILEYFKNAFIFENESQEHLNRAIVAYWNEDYLVASHLFIPLIESSIRELVKNCGGVVFKPNGSGGYDSESLGNLLDDKNTQIFEDVFSENGQNVLFYFKLILTEKLGMNLRNDWAHSLGTEKFLSRNVSDRLFHIMILLSMIKKKRRDS